MEQSWEQTDNRDHAARQARLRLAAIVESSDDAIIGKDLNGIITDWNKGAERLYGYSADETIGKPISIIVPSGPVDDVVEIMAKIRAGETIKHFETVRRKKDGTLVEVSLTVSPILDTERRIIGVSTIARDISERKHQEAALRESEEALRQKDRELSETRRFARVGSFYCDARSGSVTWSEELYLIAGLDPSLPAPTHKDEPRHFAAESWEQLQAPVQEALRNGTPYELDLEMVRPDGTTRWVKAHGEPVSDTAGRIVALRGVAQDITELKLAEEGVAGMSHKLLEAQEQERIRIGRELHDDVNQRLALLSVEIQRVKEVSPITYGELRSRMDELGKRTSEISAVVQFLSHELHSSRLEYLGLVSAMRGFCKEFGGKHEVEVVFASEGMPPIVPPELSLCLIRVTQEGLRNALKHSGVKLFEVKLHGSPTDIRLTVRDSGVGFDPELIKDTQGLGLISMQERVRLAKGTISITSRPQSGTEISVRVPLSARTPNESIKSEGA